MGEPVEIVVDRVIDAAIILTAKADVERRDAQMVNKRRVVAAGTERADAKIGARARIFAVFRAAMVRRAAWPRFHTEIFFSGSVMSRATVLTNFSSECEPSTPRKPRPLPSVLM